MRLNTAHTYRITVTPGHPLTVRNVSGGLDTAYQLGNWPVAHGPADGDRAARAHHMVRVGDWQPQESFVDGIVYVGTFHPDLDAIEAAQAARAAALRGETSEPAARPLVVTA